MAQSKPFMLRVFQLAIDDAIKNKSRYGIQSVARPQSFGTAVAVPSNFSPNEFGAH
jgi:hypothetical protein